MPEQTHEPASKRAVRGILWLGSTNIIWQLASWVLTLLTARVLNPTDYGLMALIETVAPYLVLIATFNVPTWIVQAKVIEAQHEKALFTLCVLFGSVVAVLGFFLAPLVSTFYGSSDLELPLRVVCISFFFQGLYALPHSLLQRELCFKTLALMKLSVGISRSVIQLWLAYEGFGYWALVFGFVYRDIAYTLWLLCAKGLPRGFIWDFGLYKKALSFGLHATAAQIAWIVFSTADDVIIGKFLGVQILGYYSLAFMLMDLPMSKLNTVLRPVMLPYFAKLKDSPAELRKAFLHAAKGLTGAAFALLAGLLVVAPEAILLILGEKWLPAVLPLVVLCFAGAVRGAVDIIPPLFLSLGCPKKELYVNLASIALMVPCFLILGSMFGLNGILLTWAAVFPITALVMVWVLSKTVQISMAEYLANLKAPLAAALFLLLVTLGFSLLASQLSPLVLLCGKVLLGALAYCGVLWVFYKEEVRQYNPWQTSP